MEIYPKWVTKHCIEKIFEQMNKQIYILNENERNFEAGFFCSINYKDKNVPIKVLIINKYLKTEEINNNINIPINNKNQNIDLGDIIYKNKDYNITIFEIKENYNININYIEIDDLLYNNEPEMYFNKEPIYIIQWNNKEEMVLSYGIIKNIKNSNLIYSGDINSELKYSLIFKLSNNKLIGIKSRKSNNYNIGIFFGQILNEFLNKYKYIEIFKRKKRYKFNPSRNHILKILDSLNIILEYFLCFFNKTQKENINELKKHIKNINSATLNYVEKNNIKINTLINQYEEVAKIRTRKSKSLFFESIYNQNKKLKNINEKDLIEKTEKDFELIRKLFNNEGIKFMKENLLKICGDIIIGTNKEDIIKEVDILDNLFDLELAKDHKEKIIDSLVFFFKWKKVYNSD